MTKLVYTPQADHEVNFKNETSLLMFMARHYNGMVFAVDEEDVVFTAIYHDDEWIISNADRRQVVSFHELVTKYDLYHMGNDQLLHVLDTYE